MGNIHLSWDLVINRIRLDGLIYSLESYYYYYYYNLKLKELTIKHFVLLRL